MPQFSRYLEHRLLPLIEETVYKPQLQRPDLKHWTNNNCESANHILKQQVKWKPQNLTDLIKELHSLVQVQYKDLKRSMLQRGNFRLAAPFKKHEYELAVWSAKTEQDRDKMFLKLLKDNKSGVNPKFMFSTDQSKFCCMPSGGKKPGQRKRMRCATTTSKSSKARKLEFDTQ